MIEHILINLEYFDVYIFLWEVFEYQSCLFLYPTSITSGLLQEFSIKF